MVEWIFILAVIPMGWFLMSLSIELIKLFKLWIHDKFLNIKELKLWD